MATYMGDGKELYLYGVNSSIFQSNDGYWPCKLDGDINYYNINTNFAIKQSDGNIVPIRALSMSDIKLSASGSTTGSTMYVYFTALGGSNAITEIGKSIGEKGAELYFCTSNNDLYASPSTNFTGNGNYLIPNSKQSYYLRIHRVLKEGGGESKDFTTASRVTACTGSANYTGGTCCSSADNLCKCETSNSGSSTCTSDSRLGIQCSSDIDLEGCVSEDTKILTKVGYKFAKDITSEDILISFKDSTLIENPPHTSIFVLKDIREIYKIIFEDNSILFITENHPILCSDNIYRDIMELKIGSEVCSISGAKKIKKIELSVANCKVYNFLVNGDNFIAEDIVLSCEDINSSEKNIWFITNDKLKEKTGGGTCPWIEIM